MMPVRAIVLTGYGLNCDLETDHCLKRAGAESHRTHINELLAPEGRRHMETAQILILGGGFSWADDHGAGVLMAAKLKNHMGDALEAFVERGGLILGICNGFQALVNLGLLPALPPGTRARTVALTCNDCGNFLDTWVHLRVHASSPCVFTRGMERLELPVRHGEGKFLTDPGTLDALERGNQVVLTYADPSGAPAAGRFPMNPNGSLKDIAGISDPSGRVFGLMPHPEAFSHVTNHPDWTRTLEDLRRKGRPLHTEEGEGVRLFRNAVEHFR